MNPTRYPVNGQDLFNYLAKYFASDHQLHAVLSFSGLLDEQRLAKAIRYTLDIEPVLGCRFVEDRPTPYWERRDDLDQIDWCPVIKTTEPQVNQLLQQFWATPTEPTEDPLVQARIFRTHQDILCIKIDHSCSDGGGLKEYVKLVEFIYNQLGKNLFFTPEANPHYSRESSQIFAPLGITEPLQSWDQSRTNALPTWSFPSNPGEDSKPTHTIRQIDKEHFALLKEYSQSQNVTVNDLLITAYYRAFFTVTDYADQVPRCVQVTVDLRRYHPNRKADGICNLSGSEHIHVSHEPNERFDHTLQRVKQQMDNHKQNLCGMHTAFVFEFFASLGLEGTCQWFQGARASAIQDNLSTPFLSNFGYLSEAILSFGDLQAEQGYMISPCFFSPGFMASASTYNDVLTLCVGYYQSSRDTAMVETFLDLMITELLEVIKENHAL